MDDNRPGTFTLLYYPVAECRDGWDGETVFFDEAGEIALAVKLRPNRAIFFDSRILHVGRPPSRVCPALRVTVAYKLEIVRERDKADVLHVIEEGARRGYRLSVGSAVVQQAVQQHLASLAKNVKLPGFRDGKIPDDVLQQRYGAEAWSQAVKRLVAEAMDRALPKGTVASAVGIQTGETSGDVKVQVTATYLPALPPINFSRIPLERRQRARPSCKPLE